MHEFHPVYGGCVKCAALPEDGPVCDPPPAGRRPAVCCGVCPSVARGGFDCTCRGNPNCPNYRAG